MVKPSTGIKDIISLLNRNKKYPLLDLVEKNPQAAAIMSKLVRVREQNHVGMNHGGHNIDQSALTEISNSIKERGTDAENMMQLFPELELCAQILISSIISPKDMMNTEIIYKIRNNFLASELTSTLLKKIKEELENEYNIRRQTPEILREMLFTEGSHIKLVIPESSLDAIINDRNVQTNYIATEGFKDLFISKGETKQVKGLGLLGSNENTTIVGYNRLYSNISLESFGQRTTNVNNFPEEIKLALPEKDITYQVYTKNNKDSSKKSRKETISAETIKLSNNTVTTEYAKYITVSDNFNLLKLPSLALVNNSNKVKGIIRDVRNTAKLVDITHQVSIESYTATSFPQIEAPLYHNTANNTKQFVRIKTNDNNKRKSVGRPLVLKCPPESCIPVHVPGNEKHHIGYFFLIDDEGNFISKHNNYKYTSNLQTSLNNSQNSMSSFLLQKSRNNLMGPTDTKNITIDQATRIYSEVIEDDLMNRLQNGKYGNKFTIAKAEDVYRIMLARTFANQFTKLVFVPIELVTYFAYKHNKNGVGKTILEDMRILMSLRAMAKFARVMGSLKNSIGTTEVKLKLDPDDPDPQKTAELAVHELMRTRQQTFPLGINSPTDIVDWVQRVGIEISFEGHPKLPDMAFEFNSKQASTTLPDNDLDESLRKDTIEAFGLSPETVDNGFAAEFATTVVANNILLSKRVAQHQESFEPQLSDHARKLIMNDSLIKDDLIKIIMDNKDAAEDALSDEEKAEFAQLGEAAKYEFILEEFIDRLELTLPKPNTTTLNTQMTDVEIYISALDKTLDSYISEEIFNPNYSGDISGSIGAIKAVVRAGLIRRFLADNNIMDELTDLVSKDEDGKPKMDIYSMQSDHLNGIIASSVNFIKGMSKMKDAANKDLAKMNISSEVSSPSSPDNNNDMFSDTGSNGMDDLGLGGDDDLGLGGSEESKKDGGENEGNETIVSKDVKKTIAGKPEEEPKEENEVKKESNKDSSSSKVL